MKTALFILLVAGLVAGCATDYSESTSAPVCRLVANGRLVLTTNIIQHFNYKLQIHIVCAGDTVAKIAHQFHTSVTRLEALNPDLNPSRLTIGMKILVAEEQMD